MNAAYLIAIIALISSWVPLYFGARQRDNYGTTGGGVALILAGAGLLFTAFIFAMMGLEIQYPGSTD